VVRHYQRHHTAKACLGEGGNRAWIDPMFVERIRTDLELNANIRQLGQLLRQVVRPCKLVTAEPSTTTRNRACGHSWVRFRKFERT
jgi:hypothetical protein